MNIVIINGPNLNMLGKRDINQYGTLTLKEINTLIKGTFPYVSFKFFQSNHEGKIIDYLQKVKADGILINPGAFTHYSIAIRDALEVISIPKIEVHLSNIYKRESFRSINYIKEVVNGSYYGEKEQSYIDGIKKLIELINEK